MSKIRMFIGSSVENLDAAFALQEELEYDAECTVWTQGIFNLSRSTISDLIQASERVHTAAFIFAPDDITTIRNKKTITVRDNVIFELGLFIGALGLEQCFIVIPRGADDMHIPTDLVGITTASYEPERSDDNINAALGPVATKIRRSLRKINIQKQQEAQVDKESPELDENDIRSILESWFSGLPRSEAEKVIRFIQVDAELSLPNGASAKYLRDIARTHNYTVVREGKTTLLLKAPPRVRPVSRNRLKY